MKKLLLLALVAIIMAGCDSPNSDGTYTPTNTPKIYVIDSCEYFKNETYGVSSVYTHKGNCRYCTERRKKELKELIEQLK